MRTGNLFVDALPPQEGERTETLLTQKNLVIERTISSADIAPHEYVQSQDEWVVLLRGNAILNVAGEIVELNAGDYLFLPAGLPHRIQHVSEGALWLAVNLYKK